MERETYFDGTSYTALNSKSECVQALGAYEGTRLKPEEITTKPYGCVFYCNRHCNLDGDWCVEGPGCQRELTKEQVFKLRDELGKYRSIGPVEEFRALKEAEEKRRDEGGTLPGKSVCVATCDGKRLTIVIDTEAALGGDTDEKP